MATTGQSLSATGHATIRLVETAPRPLVGFAMDYPAGLATKPHSHPRAQLLFAVSGVMRIDTGDAAYVVPPSTALFLPADTVHAIRMDGPVAMRALFLRQDAADRTASAPTVIAVSPLLRELIVAACAEPLHWELGGRGHFLTELALDEITRAKPLNLRLSLPQDMRLHRAVATLQSRPDRLISFEDLANTAGASGRTLTRLFRRETGLSFRQWRQQARLTEAMAALAIGMTPARAASVAGFKSQPAFGAAFRSLFGMTPGQARTLGAVAERLPPNRAYPSGNVE